MSQSVGGAGDDAASSASCSSASASSSTSSSPPISTSELAALGAARCAYRAALVLVSSCSQELLIARVYGGDAAAAQQLLTRINTVEQLAGFWIGPTKTALLDRYGRQTGMVTMTLVMAAARWRWASAPSVSTYLLYRAAGSVVACFFTAYQASLADALDPCSERYVAVTTVLDQLATLTSMLTLVLVQKLKRPEDGMLASVGCCAVAAGIVRFCTTETLPEDERRPIPWRRLVTNPLAPLAYVRRTPEVWRSTLLSLSWIGIVSGAWSVLGLYRRQRYPGWGMQKAARLDLLGQVVELVAPFGSVPFMRYFGLQSTYQWGKRLFALDMLTNVLAPSPAWLGLTPLIGGLRYDMVAEMRNKQYWRKLSGATSMEAQAAMMNLYRFVDMVLPPAAVALYTRTAEAGFPRAIFFATIALAVAHSELLTPWLWPCSTADKREAGEGKKRREEEEEERRR